MLTVLSGTEVKVWQDLGIFRADGKFHGYTSIRSSDESLVPIKVPSRK